MYIFRFLRFRGEGWPPIAEHHMCDLAHPVDASDDLVEGLLGFGEFIARGLLDRWRKPSPAFS